MKNHGSEKSGHLPTLIACFLHFDLSFMLWVLLGALGIFIAESGGLRPAEKGLLVGIPILSGSLLRVPLGLLSDRIGGKRVGTALLVLGTACSGLGIGQIKQATGSFSQGFLWLALLALVAAVALRVLVAVRDGWRWSWRVPAAVEAMDEV